MSNDRADASEKFIVDESAGDLAPDNFRSLDAIVAFVERKGG